MNELVFSSRVDFSNYEKSGSRPKFLDTNEDKSFTARVMLNCYDTLLVLDLFAETQILMSLILVPQVILEVPPPVVKSAVEFNAEFRVLFIFEKVTAVLSTLQF